MKKGNANFRIWLSSVLVAISILIMSYCLLFLNNPILKVFCVALAVISVLLTIKFLSVEQINKLVKIILVIFGIWLWSVILALVHGADDCTRFAALELLIYSGIIAFLICTIKLPTLPIKIVLYSIIVYFYIQYFVVGITTYGVNDHISGAVNTMILLTIAVTIQVLDYRDKHRIALLPCALIIPISVMSWNRTGFFCSVFYLLVVFFLGTNMSRKKSMRFLLSAVLAIIVVFVVVNSYDWFSESAMYTKLNEGGIDNTSRSSIWASYFEQFDLSQFILGRVIDEAHPLARGYDNPHNSFIMLHSQIGFFAFVLYFAMFKCLWLYYKKNKFILCLFLILILRCFFDMIFFFQPFDFAFYIFIFNSSSLATKYENLSITMV